MNDHSWPERFSHYVAHHSTVNSDIGRTVDFSRIAVHHIVVPPGERTSSPHAESLEEEFVLVLKGQPDLWLNGYIHNLSEGFAVGFPAGTGIAHTFINNTDAEVRLLVAGDKNKKENLCSFPINPELKQDCPIWWENPPPQTLGPHNGMPGPIKDSERAQQPSPYILDCKSVAKRKPFHYPGDNETFGEGFRLTNRIGLKGLGIWYDTLPAGARTAFPHAHTHEEEFVYVLKGQPTVWLDGFTQKIGPGHFAAFPSNTGLAHTLINNSDEEVIYLCIGETQNFPDEKISYPLNSLRQKECRRKGWYWDNFEPPISGSAPAKSHRQRKDHLEFQICSEADAPVIYEVLKSSPQYFERVDGCLPSLQIALHTIKDTPQKYGEYYFKECLLIRLDDQPIGVLELHANHPEKEICYIGLLLISENLFGRGLGRKCYQLAEDYIFRALDCRRIRLGISNDNDVTVFWQKMGFEPNGSGYEWKGEEKTSVVREFEKVLADKNV